MIGDRVDYDFDLFHRFCILTRRQVRCSHLRGWLPASNGRIGGTVCVFLCAHLTGIE